jgi:pimeloyl-ACP methyl ester carboxylesterase
VIGLVSSHPTLTLAVILPALLGITWVVYLTIKYAPIIGQKFEEPPLFLPLRVVPAERGESVEFATEDGLRLSGSYLRARTQERAGVLLYCHEFLSDRWSFRPYIDPLRDLGYDIFTFDFRNHGASPSEAGYSPMHWASDREVHDLRAALAYLRSRPDRDPAGFGLFGVSRGGSTALLVMPAERDVWGVITDGAFPTTGTMVAYIVRWAELYLRSRFLRALIPRWLYRVLAWSGRRQSERRLNCQFPHVERAVGRLAPRPWLMIHGARDAYISPKIAEGLFRCASGPKELWLVPDAKHNRCREREPEAYAARLLDFVDRFAPRRPVTAPLEAAPSLVASPGALTDGYSVALEASKLAGEVAPDVSSRYAVGSTQ